MSASFKVGASERCGARMSHTHAFPDPWILKHDALRATHHWTAIGPDGCMGDFDSEQGALQALGNAGGGLAIPRGAGHGASFGRWWSVEFGKHGKCKICGAEVRLRWMRVCQRHDDRQCWSGKITEGPTNERCRNVIAEGERLCHLHGHRDTFDE